MKKSIETLGKTLNREQQKQINGGYQCDWWTCVNWDYLIFEPACTCDD
jgi:hypothetical protein